VKKEFRADMAAIEAVEKECRADMAAIQAIVARKVLARRLSRVSSRR